MKVSHCDLSKNKSPTTPVFAFLFKGTNKNAVCYRGRYWWYYIYDLSSLIIVKNV